MSGRRWVGDARVEALCTVVPDAFGFLAEHGFSSGVHRAPVGRPSWDLSHAFVFASPERVVEVGLDPWAREVVTTIGSADGSSVVDLESRYVQLGLGPAQDVPCRADSAHALEKHVRQQAAVLARVLEAEQP